MVFIYNIKENFFLMIDTKFTQLNLRFLFFMCDFKTLNVYINHIIKLILNYKINFYINIYILLNKSIKYNFKKLKRFKF